ncbi:hypothetical protein [Methylobacterium crusticola]|uniref:hypothetical protein n=1 Tax=Methylobacterium crusticola TaxID=1697972 RepID=UPI001EE23215|nr:hypothetical protein [Methylobacterium crusticola]
MLAYVDLLRDEAAYLLRRYGVERRGLSDEEADEAARLAGTAQDLLTLADLYLHSATPYRDDPRTARAPCHAPAPLPGHLLVRPREGAPTDLQVRG